MVWNSLRRLHGTLSATTTMNPSTLQRKSFTRFANWLTRSLRDEYAPLIRHASNWSETQRLMKELDRKQTILINQYSNRPGRRR